MVQTYGQQTVCFEIPVIVIASQERMTLLGVPNMEYPFKLDMLGMDCMRKFLQLPKMTTVLKQLSLHK